MMIITVRNGMGLKFMGFKTSLNFIGVENCSLCCFLLVSSRLVGSRAGRSKQGCTYFILILFYSLSIISAHAKFHPSRIKNRKDENFHFWSILVGWTGRSKNGHRHIKLILCCFCPIISPHTKFHPNRTKNTKVRNFHFWSILVGRAGRSKNGRSPFNCRLGGY